MTESNDGGCLCRAVRYQLRGPLRDVLACYCGQCKKTTGNFGAATSVARDKLTLLNDAGLRWYVSSPGVRRGFCGECGGNLFWDLESEAHISVWAGTLDNPSGLKTVCHIYVEGKADFHQIPADAPQYRGTSRGTPDYPALPGED